MGYTSYNNFYVTLEKKEIDRKKIQETLDKARMAPSMNPVCRETSSETIDAKL